MNLVAHLTDVDRFSNSLINSIIFFNSVFPDTVFDQNPSNVNA